MVSLVARTYFKTAFNNKSIVEGFISNSHCGLHQYRNIPNVELKAQTIINIQHS